MEPRVCPARPGDSDDPDDVGVGLPSPPKVNYDDLDLQTGVLGPHDQDGVDNGYQDDTPPFSALCSRSFSCDSCVNISQSISLDLSNASEPDLTHIEQV